MDLHQIDSDDVYRRFIEKDHLEGGSEYSVNPSEMTPRQQEPPLDAVTYPKMNEALLKWKCTAEI